MDYMKEMINPHANDGSKDVEGVNTIIDQNIRELLSSMPVHFLQTAEDYLNRSGYDWEQINNFIEDERVAGELVHIGTAVEKEEIYTAIDNILSVMDEDMREAA